MSTLQQNKHRTGTGEPEESDDLLRQVLSYENEDVVAKIMKAADCNRAKAVSIFKDTLRFLYLCGTADGKWGPTRIIDIGWHEFIMFTRDYTEFCHEHFGRFIHHAPDRIGSNPDTERPRRTLIAAMQVFGKENLSENWAYRNAQGEVVLAPELSIEEVRTAELTSSGPCDSCGCNAACNDD